MKRSAMLSIAAFLICFVLMSQNEVMTNGDLRVGSGKTAIQLGNGGKGLALESGGQKYAGLFLNGQYTRIWSLR